MRKEPDSEREYFGSGAMLGNRDVEYTKKFCDKDGISIYEAMKEYGLEPEKVGDAAWEKGKIGAFLEAHIEQGPVLDAENNRIAGRLYRRNPEIYGDGEWPRGPCRYDAMDMRMDAVDAATKVISKIADWAREKADGTVATVGISIRCWRHEYCSGEGRIYR